MVVCRLWSEKLFLFSRLQITVEQGSLGWYCMIYIRGILSFVMLSRHFTGFGW